MKWPFVGRTAELPAAVRALTTPNRRGAALIGPPGMGKSRLAAEVVERLRRSGHTIARAYATAATADIPFGALATLLPAQLNAGNPLGHAVDHLLSRGDRLVESIDDAHLLDHASVGLLQQIIRHDRAKVLLTARPGPSTDLWHDEVVARLSVGALDREQVDDLLTRALDGPVGTWTKHLLWSRSEGNPLYLKELVTAGLASGALAQREGGWGWDGPIAMTGRLSELVAANLGRLPEPHREAVELLAYGEPLELDLLLRLTSSEVVDELETSGMLHVGTDGKRTHVRLSHPLYGSHLRASCPTLRTRARRRALAEAVEATGARRREDAMRVATWRLDSGTPASIELLARAAEQAWHARDWTLAERLSRAAVDQGGIAHVGFVLAYALSYRRASDQAEAMLTETMAVTEHPVLLAQLGSARAFILFFGLARHEDAVAQLDALVAGGLPVELVENIEFTRLFFAVAAEPLPGVRALVSELANGPSWLATTGRYLLALVLIYAGKQSEAVAMLDSNDPYVQTWRDRPPNMEGGMAAARCESLLFSGALDRLDADAGAMLIRVIEEAREAPSQSVWRVMLSHSARLRGRAGTAVQMMKENAIEHDGVPLMWDVAMLAEFAMGAALHGQTAQAAYTLVRAEAAAKPAWRLLGFTVGLARGWVLAGTGRVAEAAAVALETAGGASSHGAHAYEVIALHDAARFGADTSARLAVLASTMDDPLTGAYAVHALGRATGSFEVLTEAAARFSDLGVTLYAAEALAEVVRLHRAAGRGKEAAAFGRRLALLLEQCDADVTTPALQIGGLTSLTPRQLEVARLAVSGLTNQQIAEHLHTSKRTVDNHLHATYTALGITGRSELQAVLGH